MVTTEQKIYEGFLETLMKTFDDHKNEKQGPTKEYNGEGGVYNLTLFNIYLLVKQAYI